MGRILHMALVLTAVALLMISCSGGESMSAIIPSVTTDIMPPQAGSTAGANRHLLGFWDVWISEDRSTFEVTPVRGIQVHFNVLNILEKVCTNCLIIKNVKVLPTGELSADLMLRHPFPGQVRNTGFDVRGILIAGSDYEFPASGRKMAIGGSCLRLMNADGYTSLFNPTEFPKNPELPYLLQYTKGKYSQGEGPFDATLNPYLAYSKDKPRRMFAVGTAETHTVILDPPTGVLQFGYAVDASWVYVTGPITDPLTDFPPQANCIEAYEISVSAGEISEQTGGKGQVEVWAYDHQGADTIASVTIEAPDVFPGEFALSYTGDAPDGAAIFTGWAPNTFAAPEGEYRMLVRVTDISSDPNLGPIDAWQLSHISIAPPLPGWARTWGGDGDDRGFGVAVDEWGNIYVTGFFRLTVDFDPGPGDDYHTEGGYYNAFLSKFDPQGDFQWARTWGPPTDEGTMGSSDIAIDHNGGVYVTGDFEGLCDFDPGPGEEFHQPNGHADIFLSKFGTNGNFLWVKVWGGTEADNAEAIAVDYNGNIYATGEFEGTVDFDPGDGVDEHTANNNGSVFLSGFDSDGGFLWARTWGGEGVTEDTGYSVAVDGFNNIFVTGVFEGAVDFNPGPDEDIQTGKDSGQNSFLSKFDNGGNYIWARTWGTEAGGHSTPCDVDVTNQGVSFIAGYYSKTVDFDPGVGQDIYTSFHQAAFLTSYDEDGSYRWVKTWGGVVGIPFDSGHGVAVNESGIVYVSGGFNGTCDLNPGPGEELRISNGGSDCFLIKFNTTGDFIWVRTWGGPDDDYASEITMDITQNVFATGSYSGLVDFNPGPGEDWHSGTGDIFLCKTPPDGNW